MSKQSNSTNKIRKKATTDTKTNRKGQIVGFGEPIKTNDKHTFTRTKHSIFRVFQFPLAISLPLNLSLSLCMCLCVCSYWLGFVCRLLASFTRLLIRSLVSSLFYILHFRNEMLVFQCWWTNVNALYSISNSQTFRFHKRHFSHFHILKYILCYWIYDCWCCLFAFGLAKKKRKSFENSLDLIKLLSGNRNHFIEKYFEWNVDD